MLEMSLNEMIVYELSCGDIIKAASLKNYSLKELYNYYVLNMVCRKNEYNYKAEDGK